MLYREYDEKTLKKLQETELEILRDFQALCRKHRLNYFAGGGTAIGTFRHKGFIPWDDDIDINLLRKDYEKFLKYAKEEYSDKYEIMNAEVNENYPLMSTRWMKKGTKFKEDGLKETDLELGIFLDIYCFDNVPDNNFLMYRQAFKVWTLNKLMILNTIRRPILYFGGWKANVAYAVCGLVHDILNCLHISNRTLYRMTKKELTRYNRKRTRRVAYYFDPTPFTSIIERKDIKPTYFMPFENGKIRMASGAEIYLTRHFGDFMKLPPEEKRHNHPPYILDFGEDTAE